MASNPMQRKIRNSVLLGVLGTLIVTGAVIVLLMGMLKQKNDELNAELANKVNVYTLSQDVKAAQTLTSDMFVLKKVNKDAVPANATSVFEVIDSWYLQTKDGEEVCRDEYGLYLDRMGEDVDTIMEVQKNEADGTYFMNVEGALVKIETKRTIEEDEFGKYYVADDEKIRVYKEIVSDEYYIYKISDGKRTKEYIGMKNVPVIAKVDMAANTVITKELVVQSSEVITDDTRQEQYNMIVLPLDLMTNDYVDIRLKMPNGQNYIVLSKVQVDIPETADGQIIADTIRINLREDEILTMSSAIVEAYGINGAELYVTKYVEPAMQSAAQVNYTPNAAVTAQIQSNPNIVEVAKEDLASRYSEAAKRARNEYLQQIINATEGYQSNVESGMTESTGTTITTRQQYLESLNY